MTLSIIIYTKHHNLNPHVKHASHIVITAAILIVSI